MPRNTTRLNNLRGDDRAQIVPLSVVLMIGIAVLALTVYVPAHDQNVNSAAETQHVTSVEHTMTELRGDIVGVAGDAPRGGTTTTTVTLDTRIEYGDAWLIAPSSATAALDTPPAATVTVANATATSFPSDYWDGDRVTYDTRALDYEIPLTYTADGATARISLGYAGAAYTTHLNDNTAGPYLLHSADFINGHKVTLALLRGTPTRGVSATTTLSAEVATTEVVRVTGTGDAPVVVSVPTRLSEAAWRDALQEDLAANGGPITGLDYNASTTPNTLTVTLDGNKTYRLVVPRAAIGGADATGNAQYIYPVSGRGAAVREGGTQTIVVEVRDDANAALAAASVNASVDRGSVKLLSNTAGQDGRLRIRYNAPSDVTGSAEISVSVKLSVHCDPASCNPDFSKPGNRTVTVWVQNTDGN